MLTRLQSHRWLLLLLLVGGFCRLTSLTDGTLSTYGLDWDELNILAIAKLPLDLLFTVGTRRDFHPPGLWLLLHGWISLLGDSDFAVRSFAYVWGMLGILASYLLAFQLTRSKPIASLTALLAVFSPWLLTYAHLANNHSVHWVAAIFSWWFLLRSQKKGAWQLGYIFSTLIAILASANGIILLAYQGIYFFWQRNLWLTRRPLLFLMLGCLILWLPYGWQVIQPWHIAHAADFQRVTQAPWWALLITPLNLLFLGTEVRYWDQLPSLVILLTLSTLLGIVFWQAVRCWSYPWRFWLCLTILPILLTWGLHEVIFAPTGNKGIFHFRTFLSSIVGLHLLLAVWIDHHPKQLIQVLLMAIIIGAQLWLPWKSSWRYELWPVWGKAMAPKIQPGDGIIVYPGYYYLSLSKYITPDQFGLSQQEINFDPRRENLFHMINREDDLFLAITGRDVLSQADTQERVQAFIQHHRRVWLMITEDLDRFRPLLLCPKPYLYPVNGGTFMQDLCPTQPKINQQE